MMCKMSSNHEFLNRRRSLTSFSILVGSGTGVSTFAPWKASRLRRIRRCCKFLMEHGHSTRTRARTASRQCRHGRW